jgi:hypothetical protein
MKTTSIKSISFLAILIIFTTLGYGLQDVSENYTEYEGVVLDSDTKKPLISAQIDLEGTNISTITNIEGEFTLKVPDNYKDSNVIISHLGYKKTVIGLSYFEGKQQKILMDILVTTLTEVNITIPKDAISLVRKALDKKGDAYMQNRLIMTAFYRETIKKRRKNASLSEAVVEIYKQPYQTGQRDAVSVLKARKSTDYSRLDTLAVKLQGGPFNTIFTDVVKYPIYVFGDTYLDDYDFSMGQTTQINDRPVYTVNFKQKSGNNPLYFGKLYIDSQSFALVSAVYELNVTNKELAGRLFIRKKPSRAKVYPTRAAYRVDYKIIDGKWYYGYSNVQLAFKVDYNKKLFNSVYSLSSEMAITDWKFNTTDKTRPDNPLRPSVILTDEIIGFGDPEFWGQYNIIEPEKSIESAIRKIRNKLKKS